VKAKEWEYAKGQILAEAQKRLDFIQRAAMRVSIADKKRSIKRQTK